MEILTCLVHIDPSLLSFQFTDPVYVDVKYGTDQVSKTAELISVEVPPSVLRTINNMPAFVGTCEAGANHNAGQYWQHKETGGRPISNLNPVFKCILNGFAP